MIGLTGQFAALDQLLTGRENLEMVGLLYRLANGGPAARGPDARAVRLTSVASRAVRTYSGGMRRRLDLGASLIGGPPVLFLDEPTTGLDPSAHAMNWRWSSSRVAQGTTVLLTTQYMEEDIAVGLRVRPGAWPEGDRAGEVRHRSLDDRLAGGAGMGSRDPVMKSAESTAAQANAAAQIQLTGRSWA